MTYLYTGQEYDAEIGLCNYRARFYCAGLGRFIAIDIARQYFSPYLYASNNPVLFIDPTGMLSSPKELFSAISGILIGAIEILIGVVIDVLGSAVVAIASVFSAGAASALEVGVAALSGVFYGAGVSAITYSVFNFNDFSWKEYGIQTGLGAAGGLISGGLSAGVGMAVTAGATRVAASVGESIAERAGQEAVTYGAKAVNVGLKATKWAADKLASTEISAGWQGFAKGVAIGVAKSEAIGITWNTGKNLAMGDEWYKGLDQTIFSSALSGSIGGLQVRNRMIYGTA